MFHTEQAAAFGKGALCHVFADVLRQNLVDQRLVVHAATARLFAEPIEHVLIDADRDQLAGLTGVLASVSEGWKPEAGSRYSARSATSGSIRDARRAGR